MRPSSIAELAEGPPRRRGACQSRVWQAEPGRATLIERIYMKNNVRKAVLLLSLIASALPVQSPLVASAASGEILESDLTQTTVGTLVYKYEDIKKYNINGREYGTVHASDKGDSAGYMNTFKYHPQPEQEYNYWDGLTSHTLKWSVLAVTQVTGVYAYSNVCGGFVSKHVLEAGNATVQNSYRYQSVEGVNIVYESDYYWNVRNAVNGFVTGEYTSANLEIQSGLVFASGASYSSMQKVEHDFSMLLTLNKNSARYCPEGWGMTLGLVGTYYILEFQFHDFTNWWWGQQPTNGGSPVRYRVTVAEEVFMTTCFVHKKVNDTYNDLRSLWYLD